MTPASDPFLSGGGEMGERIRALARSGSALGPPERWSQSLKTAIRIMLTSSQPIWIGWGPHLVYLYNDPYLSIIGGKHPWALGKPTREVWSEVWDVIGPLLSTALDGDEGTYVESQLLIMERHGYREETYYTFSYSPIPDDDGSVGGIICANTDDTQRVVAERQMTVLKELAASASAARTWQDACERAAEALGGNRHDLPFAALYAAAPDARELSLCGTSGISPGHPAAPRKLRLDDSLPWPLADAFAAGRVSVVDDVAARLAEPLPAGAWDEPPASVALVPMSVPGRDVGRAILVAGLNPLRRVDAEYEKFLSLLGAQVAAGIASAQAYEEERRRADVLAELDRAKTVFFSNVSHEFRTPLTLVLGPVEDLLAHAAERELDADVADRLEVVRRNGTRLLRLVNTLLDFARIEAGRMQARFEPLDLAAVTSELASNFRSACERAGLELVVDCPRLSRPAHVDRSLWEKIVLNLVSNAFKYTLEGWIEVRLAERDGHAVLTVRDTGVGIPESELPRVFERFHRVVGSRGRTHEGSGIGLSLVRELARLHGGDVHVESAVDQGSVFRVTVPLGTAHLDPRHVESGGAGAASAGSPPQAFVDEVLRWLPGEPPLRQLAPPPGSADRRPRVVWADDNADMREYVTQLLGSRYEVEAVEDGEKALAAARRRRPDLVLSDVMMPRLDGFGLVSALRADPALATMPIILLSARSGEEARIEGAEAGADDYLIKPFSARELLARVDSHLRIARLRREAQRAVRRSESRYRSVFTTTRVAIAIYDADDRWREVNPAMCAVLGRSREDLAGRMPDEHVPEDARGRWEQVRRRLARGETWHGEIPFLRGDGSRVELEWQVMSLAGTDLRLAIATDVTEAKAADAALRESEERYRKLVTVITDIPWVSDPTGRFSSPQPEWEAYTGQEWDEYRDFGWIEALHPDDRARVLAAWERARGEREVYRAEGRLWNAPTGTYRRFTVKAVPRLNPDSTIHEWVGACSDVEEHMRIEDALRESEQRFRLMANTAPAMLWVSEPDGTCSFLSRGWYEYTGQSEVEGLGLGWLNAVHPDDRETARRLVLAANEAREPFTLDYRLRAADGSYRWAIDGGRPRVDARGAFLGFIGSVADVHELKQAEASLREKTERLEEEDRRKDLFLATLGHELRNPLAALASATRVYEQGDMSADDLQAVLTRNVDQLTLLVNDLLEVSRITRGKIELKKTPTDLVEVLHAAVRSVQASLDDKEQHLTLTTPDRLVADVDPSRIEQVLANLLSNASKYTPRDGQITTSITRAADEAVLTVQDSGIGISRTDIESIFDPFVQQDPGAGGLGIGLSLVRGLVSLHGGRVHAESPGPDAGSRFTVHLPIGHPTPRRAPTPPRRPPSPPRPRLSARVLIIDDSHDNADMLALLLGAAGAETRCAYSARQGLAAVADWHPDVALVDIGLPDMTGYEVARTIRSDEANRDMLLLAVTGYGDEGAQRMSKEAGFDARLVKPVDHAKLNELLESHLGSVRG